MGGTRLRRGGRQILTVEVGHLGQDHARGGGPQPLVQLEGAGAELDGVGGGVGGVRSLHLRVGVGERWVLPAQRRVPVHRVPVESRLRRHARPAGRRGVQSQGHAGRRGVVVRVGARARPGQEAGLGDQSAMGGQEARRRGAIGAQAVGGAAGGVLGGG